MLPPNLLAAPTPDMGGEERAGLGDGRKQYFDQLLLSERQMLLYRCAIFQFVTVFSQTNEPAILSLLVRSVMEQQRNIL